MVFKELLRAERHLFSIKWRQYRHRKLHFEIFNILKIFFGVELEYSITERYSQNIDSDSARTSQYGETRNQ